jgi:hypothetical protein
MLYHVQAWHQSRLIGMQIEPIPRQKGGAIIQAYDLPVQRYSSPPQKSSSIHPSMDKASELALTTQLQLYGRAALRASMVTAPGHGRSM